MDRFSPASATFSARTLPQEAAEAVSEKPRCNGSAVSTLGNGPTAPWELSRQSKQAPIRIKIEIILRLRLYIREWPGYR